MQKQYRLARAVLALAACALLGQAIAAETAASIPSQYQAAIASPARTDDDRKSDAKRKPAEFLAFAQARPGMKVLDLAAGGGTTAALLAAAVAPGGEVWAQTGKASARIEERIASGKAPNLRALVAPIEHPIQPGMPALDLITINMSYHDVVNAPVDRAAMNKRLYDALKPGGTLVVIDNAAKAGSGLAATKTLHRIDEAAVVEELTRAGFKVDAKSDYLRAPGDAREKPFFDMKDAPDDKFALRFVKK
jgi:predicted methyltransferase